MIKKYLKNAFIASAAAAGLLYFFDKFVFRINGSVYSGESYDLHTYKWEYGDVSYRKQGKGKPVLMIHDLSTGSSGHEWKKLAALLKKDHTVYTLDLPGFGNSSKKRMMYTGYVYVHLIRNFLRDIVEEKADIVTSGDASSLAVMTALSEKDLIGRLYMISPQDPDNMREYPDFINRLKFYMMCTPLTGTFSYILCNTKLSFIKKYREEYFYNGSLIRTEDIRAEIESAYRGGTDSRFAGASVFGKYTNMNVIHGLKGLTKRLCLIYGKNDKGAEHNQVFYTGLVPSAEVHYINNSMKRPHMEHAQEVASIIK